MKTTGYFFHENPPKTNKQIESSEKDSDSDNLITPPGLSPQKAVFGPLMVRTDCSLCGSSKKLLQLEVDYSVHTPQLLAYASCVCTRSLLLIYFMDEKFEIHLRCDPDAHYEVQPLLVGTCDFLTMESTCHICQRAMRVELYRPSEHEVNDLKQTPQSFNTKYDSFIEFIGIRSEMTLKHLCHILEIVFRHIDLCNNSGGIQLFEDCFRVYFRDNLDAGSLLERLRDSKLETLYSKLTTVSHHDNFEIINPQFHMISRLKTNANSGVTKLLSIAISDLFYKGMSQFGFRKYNMILECFADVLITNAEIESGYDIDAKYLTTSLKEFVGARIKNYVLVDHLGSGVSANVFEAHHRDYKDIRVAVKLYRPWLFEKFKEQEIRLERECELFKILKHPGIVSVFDKGVISIGKRLRHYIIMELFNGITLELWRRKHRTVKEEEWITIMRKLATALKFLHDKGIYHRDIKPENVMIEASQERVIIMDFGVIKVLDHKITETGQFLGTRLYAPPEYLSGEENINWEKVDIYCLGGVGYYLWVGKCPWQLEKQNLNWLMEQKSSPTKLPVDASKSVKGIVDAMLEVHPDDRPTLDVVINELD